MSRPIRVLVIVMATAMVGAPAAQATTREAPRLKRSDPLGAVPATAPPGYAIVTNSGITAAAGNRSFGTATCPSGKVVFGGGALIASSDLAANINGSVPWTTTSWGVWVDNGSASSTTFDVYAVCGKKPKGYKLVNNSTTNPAGTQTTVSVTCPGKTKILGGGGFSNVSATTANINSSHPYGNGWRIDMNNGSTSSGLAVADAVCAKKVNGRTVITGATVSNPATTETLASASCSGTKVPLSGGVSSSSGSTLVNLNSSYPSGNSWNVFENNASASAYSITPYVICAGK